MFTGLIREIGTIKSFEDSILSVYSNLSPNIGDSIAINGVCLSVIDIFDGGFSVQIANQTKNIIAIENMQNTRSKVHLESAMRLSDKLEGHIMQGHIDCTQSIKDIKKTQNGSEFVFSLSKDISHLVVHKGSIAIDGVSLTVYSVNKNCFSVVIIPHTLQKTLFESYTINRRVNIETDIINRSIFHMLNKRDALSWGDVDRTLSRF